MSRLLDLTGHQFHRLTVLHRHINTHRSTTVFWCCRCECGMETIVASQKLRSGHTKSCGCLNDEARRQRAIDISGQRFGRLVALRRVESKHYGAQVQTQWECHCDCGININVSYSHLSSGNTKSCGCLQHDVGRMHGYQNIKHGLSHKQSYQVWRNMMARCYNPRTKSYKNYGACGIVVDAAWHDFEQFWRDMGEPPAGLTLERRDNAGPYCQENCLWASYGAQNRNYARNVWLELHGESHVLADWATITGIQRTTLRRRLRLGWSVERALTTPVDQRFSHTLS